jgi:hypothetical protein
MPCELTRGFELSCLEGIGGVKEIFVANYTYFDSGIVYGGPAGAISELPGTVGDPITVWRYQPFRNSGSYVETVNKSLETGTLFFTQEVSWTFGKLTQVLRNEFLNLSKAKMVVFVRTNDDQILMIGAGGGADLSAGTVQTGAQKADLMGYQVTVTAEELAPAVHLVAFGAGELPFENFPGIYVDPPYVVGGL